MSIYLDIIALIIIGTAILFATKRLYNTFNKLKNTKNNNACSSCKQSSCNIKSSCCG